MTYMSYSFTLSESQTFTLAHAKHIASKVATDLKRIQRFYGAPTDHWIEEYEKELIELLKKGYLKEITYGFQRHSNWIEPTLKYTAKDLAGMSCVDDDPGRIRPGADIAGAYFTSYLVNNSNYANANEEERNAFENSLPFRRTSGSEPGITGYLSSDKTYSAGGKALERSIVKSY